MDLSVVILAAGQGSRMRSRLPKVLHKLAHKPLLTHVIDVAEQLSAQDIHVVYGHGGEVVRDVLADRNVSWVKQEEQLGTGHAVAQAAAHLIDDHTVLVLYGDVPLTTRETLQQLLEQVSTTSMGLLTAVLPNPHGYGRIVRNSDRVVQCITEEKDATEAIRKITEVNTGILAVSGGKLKEWLGRLKNNNAQGEYYLTDIIAMAVSDGIEVKTSQASAVEEVEGINNRSQLARIERYYQRQQAEQLMAVGVTLKDPARFDLRGTVETGSDVVIDINVILEGNVVLGNEVEIGANCVITNTTIADGCIIFPNSVIENATLGRECTIGPFARIRPDTNLAAKVKVGNFVEVKKAEVGEGSKISHLSYVGDSIIGKDVNIGAGTITCNYDGANKHITEIGDGAFIGSDSQLVAPVKIGAGATIGAGSTITSDTPAGALTLTRTKQRSIESWTRPQKKK
ncbi:N-acetylglucosamine-1-phosphate uridyltransferase / Glucosamine-1-phosphate N-acetyltransferase [hydrothermal vent metagenome]|uniref:N-acetylglucosamine-1-phosphate uridyltransferase / Glucosamine-1-phosphate N-acetyltransferase n=1 Tax=hydrothermal vent metagenome TaxID=652676 RepID=A0A3B0Z8M7_9ZZZZ